METIVIRVIERYLQVLEALKQLEESRISIGLIDDIFFNDFELKLAASILYPDIIDDPDHEFFIGELSSICDDVYESNLEIKANVIVSIFNDILKFFESGIDHGTSAESNHTGTVYFNKEGESLKLESLYREYRVL